MLAPWASSSGHRFPTRSPANQGSTSGRPLLLSGVSFVPVDDRPLRASARSFAFRREQGIGFVENISAKLGLRDVFEALPRELRKRLRLVLSNAIIGSSSACFQATVPRPRRSSAMGSHASTRRTRRTRQGRDLGIMGPAGRGRRSRRRFLVPMITLGIPGSPTSAGDHGGAVHLGPPARPVLFIQHPDFVWGLIASIYLGHC